MRIPFISLIAAGALALGGCAYGDMVYGLGYGGGYGLTATMAALITAPAMATASAGYGGYGPYYGGYGGYGGYGRRYGWYDDYYYPGTGIYVYDSYRRPHAMTTTAAALLDIALAGASHHVRPPAPR